MRITKGLYYNNFVRNNQRITNNLAKSEEQLASGKKIRFGYEDSNKYIQTLGIDNSISVLNQIKDSNKTALNFTNSTDKALIDMRGLLDKFYTKLIFAANNVHSPQSYRAIANDLSGIRNNIMNIVNTHTNIGYIFSGTNLEVKPLDDNDNYRGNDKKLSVPLGTNLNVDYNITGKDIFFGTNIDSNKVLNTNVPLYNQRLLHPKKMIRDDVGETIPTPQQTFIKRSDNIRDLVGDTDNLNKDKKVYFYIAGARSSGQTFKKKIILSSKNSVADLFHRIGIAFGNTDVSKIVDVNLVHGNIEIKDLLKGSSKLQFHMLSSYHNVDDINNLSKMGYDYKSFVKSDYSNLSTINEITAVKDKYRENIFKLPTTLFGKYAGKVAVGNTALKNIFTQTTNTITLEGRSSHSKTRQYYMNLSNQELLTTAKKKFATKYTPAQYNSFTRDQLVNLLYDSSIIRYDFKIGPKTELKDLLNAIEQNFGNVKTSLYNGEIVIQDLDASENKKSAFTLKLKSANNIFSNGYGISYSDTSWVKDKRGLTSNIPQVVTYTNELATDETKLLKTSGLETLNGQLMNIKGVDVNGKVVTYTVHFDANSTYITDKSGKEVTKVYNNKGNFTKADDLTYKQLFGVVSMILSGNLPIELSPTAIRNKKLSPIQAKKLDSSIYSKNQISALSNISVKFNSNGTISIHNNNKSQNDMNISISGAHANIYDNTNYTTTPFLFSANNAVVANTPRVDFFNSINHIIEAVYHGKNHPKALSKGNSRNLGIANSILELKGLMNHLQNQHIKISSVTNALDNNIDRINIENINNKTFKSQKLDTDFAEASTNISQNKLRYKAIASTAAKIKDLTLLNFMR